MNNKELNVLEKLIRISKYDYFSLTNIAKYKNKNNPKDVVKNWLRRKETIGFLGIWEN